jgi:hypothetical protein
MAAEPIDDIVVLGGQNFAAKGNLQGNAVSEFETGVKIGPARLDNREHAFFVVLNDFSGGFGTRQVDIREELGTFWYPEDNSPETAFAGRITLPIKQELISITDGPDSAAPHQYGHPYCRTRENTYLFSVGSAIYKFSAATIGGQPVKHHDTSEFGGSAAAVITLAYVTTAATSTEDDPSVDFDTRVYACYGSKLAGGSVGWPFSMAYDNEGASFTRPTQKWYTGVPEYATHQLSVNWVYKRIEPKNTLALARAGGNGGSGIGVIGSDVGWEILIPTFNGGYRPLDFYTGEETAPANFIEGNPHPQFIGRQFESSGVGQLSINDLFYWDKKLLGGSTGGQFYFLVPRRQFNLLEELEWSFDDDGYITDMYGIKEPSHISGTTPAVVGTPGEEPWNVVLGGVDGEAVGVVEDSSVPFFVGTAEGPTGESLPYIRAGRKLHVLDFYARQLIPIEIGAAGPLVSGDLINGEIVVTDAWNVFAYSKGGVRNVGLPKKPGFGIPPNLLNTVGSGTQEIAYIFPSDHYIMAVVVDKSDVDHPSTTLYRHSGTGWHQVGKKIEDFVGFYGFQVHFGEGAVENLERYIVIPGMTTVPPASTVEESPDTAYALFTLPNLTHQGTVGRDEFGDSGAAFVTGWYDGGFLDIEGTLLRLNIDAWSLTATETVKVEYRLDNDETASWIQMVDVNGAAAVFDNTHTVLYFDADPDDPRQGVQFRTVQYRIELTRGADATRSPELRALNQVYLKTPPLRTSWTLAIDVNRMIERSAGTDTTFYVDGAPATLESIWAKLRELWDTHPLLTFSIPNVQEDFFVKLTDMPLTFDDFRNAVQGQGQITIQVLEPVETT